MELSIQCIGCNLFRHSLLYPGINRTLTKDEYDEVMDYALELGLENAFIQELESQEHYLPDFAQESPFNSASSIPGSSVTELTGSE